MCRVTKLVSIPVYSARYWTCLACKLCLFNSFCGSATVRMVPEPLHFQDVCPLVVIYYMISYKLLVTVWPDFQLQLQFGTQISWLDFEVKKWKFKVTARHIWSNKHFGRHFLICLRNAWTYFNETCHNYSVSGPHDTDDIFSVMLGHRVSLVFTALHGMQMRSYDEISVCLSVKRVHCDKTEERYV